MYEEQNKSASLTTTQPQFQLFSEHLSKELSRCHEIASNLNSKLQQIMRYSEPSDISENAGIQKDPDSALEKLKSELRFFSSINSSLESSLRHLNEII
jgi:predicted RNase H-like nuclease (RuvC/YqgF family)